MAQPGGSEQQPNGMAQRERGGVPMKVPKNAVNLCTLSISGSVPAIAAREPTSEECMYDATEVVTAARPTCTAQ